MPRKLRLEYPGAIYVHLSPIRAHLLAVEDRLLSVKQIAERLHLGKPKGARTNLHKFMNRSQAGSPQIQLGIQ